MVPFSRLKRKFRLLLVGCALAGLIFQAACGRGSSGPRSVNYANDYGHVGIDTAFHDYDAHGSVTNARCVGIRRRPYSLWSIRMLRITKLACMLSALALLVSCGGVA